MNGPRPSPFSAISTCSGCGAVSEAGSGPVVDATSAAVDADAEDEAEAEAEEELEELFDEEALLEFEALLLLLLLFAAELSD